MIEHATFDHAAVELFLKRSPDGDVANYILEGPREPPLLHTFIAFFPNADGETGRLGISSVFPHVSAQELFQRIINTEIPAEVSELGITDVPERRKQQEKQALGMGSPSIVFALGRTEDELQVSVLYTLNSYAPATALGKLQDTARALMKSWQ